MVKVNLYVNNIIQYIKKEYGRLVTLALIAIFFFAFTYLLNGSLYLKCIFKSLTGYDCPACGLQRAIVNLSQGNFVEAFWVNPYLALIFPYIALLLFSHILKRENLKKKITSMWVVIPLATITLSWWIIRNTLL